MEELKMDVRLTTKGLIEAHDLQTKFAVSSVAPGMKALCKFAVSNGNHIDAEGILEIGYASNKAAATNLIKAGFHYGLWDEHGVLTSEGLETAKVKTADFAIHAKTWKPLFLHFVHWHRRSNASSGSGIATRQAHSC